MRNRANRRAWFWHLLFGLVWVTEATAAIPPGVGKFTFTNPLTEAPVTVHYVKDADYDPGDPPVLVFHGMLRNPEVYRDGWIALAKEHHLLVIVPHFSDETYPGTAGYNLGNLFSSETDLTRNPEKTWSYHLPRVVFTYLHDYTKDTTAAGYMAFGHSAGSQFLHRQIAFAPDPHLLLAIAANAGWYTFPDPSVNWPYGLGGTGFNPALLRPYFATSLVVLLGEADTDRYHSSLRRTPEAMKQGNHRLERGQRFFAAGKALAERRQTEFAWQIQTVPGVDHDNGRMAPPAAKIMADFILQQRASAQPPEPE